MSDYTRVLVYQYPFTLTRNGDSSITWEPSLEDLDKLFLGLQWKDILLTYSSRNDFYWGFEIKGESDMFPILEAKVELEIGSLSNPHFILEMAVMPSKITESQRVMLNELFIKYKSDEEFIAFWDDDPKGPGKRQANLKKKLVKALETIPIYKGENDISPEKAMITPSEALIYFGFDKNKLPTEEEFKKKLREMQLKCHPDANNGDEKEFKHLQKCKKVIEEFVLVDD